MDTPALNRGARFASPTQKLVLLIIVGAVLLFLAFRHFYQPRPFSTLRETVGRNSVVVTSVFPQPLGCHSVIVFWNSTHETTSATLENMAELGYVAMSIKLPEEPAASIQAITDVSEFLKGKKWADPHATVWVANHQNAPLILSGIAPLESQPGYIIFRSLEEPISPQPAEFNLPSSDKIKSEIVLVRNHQGISTAIDQTAERLTKKGLPIKTIFFDNPPLDGMRETLEIRLLAEAFAARLPIANYEVLLSGTELNADQVSAFNIAMRRAGENRGNLMKVLASLRGVKLHNAVMSLSHFEDYDLANMSTTSLLRILQNGWAMRETYSWCRNTPLELFETYTLSPRVAEERLNDDLFDLRSKVHREIKYCHNTQEACDAIFYWMHRRSTWRTDLNLLEPDPREIFDAGGGDCSAVMTLYTHLGRMMGIAMRPAITTWPHKQSSHAWSEVWDEEQGNWHAIDCTADDRPYNYDWMNSKIKPFIYTLSGKPGVWNAANEMRWEAFSNSIALFHPSGKVIVQVTERQKPLPNAWVNVELDREGETLIARAITDNFGKAQFSLGESYQKPYRVHVDNREGKDWAWVEVHSNQTYKVNLDLENRRFFSKAEIPPPLATK